MYSTVQGFEQELKLAFSRGTRNKANEPPVVKNRGEPKPKDASMPRACAEPFFKFRFILVSDSRYLYFHSIPSCGQLVFFRVILHSGNDWHRLLKM